jgi:cobalt-zinc-cadmium efflux system protein
MVHKHNHEGATANLSRAFALGVALNVAFVVVEAIYGVVANSTALLANAAHNASNVLGLGLAWGAAFLASRKPSQRHTYGLRSSTVLAALANSVLLHGGRGRLERRSSEDVTGWTSSG